jgi:hypothetical protein
MGDGPGRSQRIAALLLTLVMIWMTLPEHQRRLIMMRAVHRLKVAAARAARSEGHAGMANELAGQHGDAARRYGAAYHLSRWRDSLARTLDSFRA